MNIYTIPSTNYYHCHEVKIGFANFHVNCENKKIQSVPFPIKIQKKKLKID